MTTIGNLLARDWGTQYLDESGQWIQSDSGNQPVSGNGVFDEQGRSIANTATAYFSGGTLGAGAAAALGFTSFQDPVLPAPVPPAPVADPVPVAVEVPAAVPLPAPPAAAPSAPAAPAPHDRSADEWASIAAAWSGNQGNFYRLYQQMDEHGWDAADIAHVSGMSLQDVGDYFTRGGAPAGFGGAVTLGRDAVDAPYLAALAAEDSRPPAAADAARPWWSVTTVPAWSTINENGQIVDESGNVQPTVTFDVGRFTAWYVSQNTPEAQTFARIHGAFSAGAAGSIRFASDAVVSAGGFDEAGQIVTPTITWAMDSRITQYAGYAKGNALDEAAMQAIVQSPLAQQFLQIFAPDSLAKALPENELGERMRARYGSDLATFMYQLQGALDAMRSQYMNDLNATLAQKPTLAGVQSPFWTPGAVATDESGHPLYDESGRALQSYSFDAGAYQQWYSQQPDPRHQLIGLAWGSGALATNVGFKTTGALDSLHFAFNYDESGTPIAHDVTLTDGDLSPQALTEIDIGDPPDLYDNSGVGFMPMRGFVTSSENLKPEDDWLDQLVPMLIVAAVAYFSAGTLGPAAAGAMGMTTTVATAAGAATVLTTTGVIVSAAVAGAITAAVSGAINDNFSFKGILQGALAGALTAGLLQGVQAATGVPMTGPASSGLVTAGRVAAQATVQGAVQALLGGSFKDGAIAGLATGLASAIGGQLDGSITEAIRSGAMTAAEGAAARYFSSMLGAAIRIVGNGEGSAGYALASAFVNETFTQLNATPYDAQANFRAGEIQQQNADAAAQAPAPAPVASTEPAAEPAPPTVADASEGGGATTYPVSGPGSLPLTPSDLIKELTRQDDSGRLVERDVWIGDNQALSYRSDVPGQYTLTVGAGQALVRQPDGQLQLVSAAQADASPDTVLARSGQTLIGNGAKALTVPAGASANTLALGAALALTTGTVGAEVAGGSALATGAAAIGSTLVEWGPLALRALGAVGLVFVSGSVGGSETVVDLNDNMRIVKPASDVINGYLELRDITGQWYRMDGRQFSPDEASRILASQRTMALTEEQIRQLQAPLVNVPPSPPPLGTPGYIPPADGETNSGTPGYIAADPADAPKIDPTPMHQPDPSDFIIQNNADNGNVRDPSTSNPTYRGVELVDSTGKPIGEFDRIEGNRFVEDKSANGLDTINPKTGAPYQTADQWARRQIFDKTVNRIDNLSSATSTRPTVDGTPNVPSIEDIRNYTSLEFRVENDSDAVRQTTLSQLDALRLKYPQWTFTAKFGK